MSEDWYAPNQQAVRADGSGPAEEGEGGAAGNGGAPADELDAMTKDQLLAEAEALGIEGVTSSMTKDEIKAAIRAG